MTAIVYWNHVLYADRRQVTSGLGSKILVEDNSKIFVSKNKQVAWGITGRRPDDVLLEDLEIAVRKCVKNYLLGNTRFDTSELPTNVVKHFSGSAGNMIVMTKHTALEMAIMSSFVILVSCSACYGGTGGGMALTALVAGKTPKAAFTLVSRLDRLTGETFDTIKQSSLKPFVITS